ncbi:MAG: endonuclease III [Rectinema sp.]
MKSEASEMRWMSTSTATLLEEVYRRLTPLWPDAHPLLHYHSCFELLIAVILSAQTTDEQVNMVTEELFDRFPTAGKLALADIAEIERIIHPVGFFHVKARHIIDTAKALEERFGGNIPPTLEEMLELPGVGRKTANLVASACHEVPGIIVDTHVLRVLVRLGVCPKKDAALAESIVRANLSHEKHTQFSYSVNRHGKFTCTARKPACTQAGRSCPLSDLCPQIGVKR